MNRKNTSPDYGNWVPIAMMKGMAAVLLALLALTIVLAWLLPFPLPAVLTGILTAVLFLLWLYMLRCRALFDFSRGGLMGKLHQYLLDHLDWNGRGRLLEIGCGSGALLNRCAKRYPQANFTGIDYWGAEWSYAKEQCQKNAVLEGVSDRVNFQKGDAARLDFPDQTFDAAVSNFVFHEVRSQKDKRLVVREALRVLKKGGSFSFQDLFSQKSLYGDMEEFADELRREGFREIHYIPFVERQGFVPRYVQAPWMLSGVGLLYGKK
mgnify:FL=1